MRRGWGERIVAARRWVVLAWVAVAVASLPLAARVEQLLDVSARVAGSESAMVDDILSSRFDSPFAHYAVLVITGAPSATTPEGRNVLRRIADGVKDVEGVAGTFSHLDVADTMLVGTHGDGSLLLAGLQATGGNTDRLIAPLRERTQALQRELISSYPAITLRWTGEGPLNYDLRQTSAREAQRAERLVLPLTLVLLFMAFGSVIASIIPIVAALLAIAIALAISAVITVHWPLSILLQNIITMIGLGLGIDYALLVVSRFREAMDAGATSTDAAVAAVRHAGRTILISGSTVAIGFAALLTVPLNELRSVAVGGLLVVIASMLVATTLVPLILSWLGRRVDLGRVRFLSREGSSLQRWRRWGAWVARHPLAVLCLGALPMVLLASQSSRLSTSLPRGNWLPKQMESAIALRDLEKMTRSGLVYAVRVVVELPDGVAVESEAGWTAVHRTGEALLADARVARIRSLPSVTRSPRPNSTMLSLLPPSVRRTLATADGRTALIEVMPREGVDYLDLTSFVDSIRANDPISLTGLLGTRVLLGGMPAFNADYQHAVDGHFPRVIAIVVLATLVAMCFAFRSVLIPLKAVTLNLLTVAAAYGAVVLVFQDGHGVRLFGLDGPVQGIFAAVPSIVFCIVFGLSMDYEVFLLERVAEARRGGLRDDAAVTEGLSRTGGLITSAAAIMVVVFAGFTLGDFITVKILGFALAAAVILDATLIRIAIGPALLLIAGRWNWWPGKAANPVSVSAP